MTNRILVPIDLDHESTFDSIFAATSECADPKTAEIILLTIVPQLNLGYFASTEHRYMQKIVTETQLRLEALGHDRVDNTYNWQAQVKIGDPKKRIVKTAAEQDVRLIIMASHDPHKSDIIFGSVAAYVVRHAHQSVLVVRQHPGVANTPET